MTAITLPPLPEPFVSAVAVTYLFGGNIKEPVYTAAQVEQIRRDAVRAALGAAVKACGAVHDELGGVALGRFVTDFGKHTHMSMAAGAKNCEVAIRALMPKEEGK